MMLFPKWERKTLRPCTGCQVPVGEAQSVCALMHISHISFTLMFIDVSFPVSHLPFIEGGIA